MKQMQMVSSREAVLKSIDDMGLSDFRNAPVILTWIEDAVKSIGGKYQYDISNHVLMLDCCQAKLPCGTFEIKGILLGDHGTECDLVFNQFCDDFQKFDIDYTSKDTGIGLTVITGGASLKYYGKVKYVVRDGYIVFDKQLDEDYITVKVQRYFTDENGFLMVPEEYLKAIVYYVMLKMAERSMFDSRIKNTVSRGINHFQSKWDFYCRQARAQASKNEIPDQNETVAMWNNPFSGYAFVIE